MTPDMIDYPEGTIFIEIRDIYDGWSVAQLPDGTLINRWDPEDRRYLPTQKWIDEQGNQNEPIR